MSELCERIERIGALCRAALEDCIRTREGCARIRQTLASIGKKQPGGDESHTGLDVSRITSTDIEEGQ